LTKQHTFAIAN